MKKVKVDLITSPVNAKKALTVCVIEKDLSEIKYG